MKEFDLSRAQLTSRSEKKHILVRGAGGIVIDDKVLEDGVYEAEEGLYKELAKVYVLKDGLIAPFWIKYGEIEAPLPVVVTLSKIRGVQELVEEDEYYRNLERIDVHDSLWIVADEMGNFDKAIELVPWSCMAYLNRGIAYRHLGQLEQANQDFQKAIEHDSTITIPP